MAEGGAAYNEQASMLSANPGLKLEAFSGGGSDALLDRENTEAVKYEMDGGARGMIDGLESEGLEVSKFLIAIGFGKPNTFAGYTFNDVAYNTFKEALGTTDDTELYNKINGLMGGLMSGGGPLTNNIKDVLIALYNFIYAKSNKFTDFTFLYDGASAKMTGGAAPIGTIYGDIKINLEKIFTNYSDLITKLQLKEKTEFAGFNPIAFDENDKQKLIDIESFLEVINDKLQNDNNDDNLDFISEFILKINSFNDLLRIYSESKNVVNQSSEVNFDAIKTAYEPLNTEYKEVIAQIDADYDERVAEQESSPESNSNVSSQSAAPAAAPAALSLPAPPSSNFNIPEPQGPATNLPISSSQTSPNYQEFIQGFHGYLTQAVEQGYIPNWKGSYKDSKKLQSIMDTLSEDSPIREQFEAEKDQLDPKSAEIVTMHEYDKNKAQKYLDVARSNLNTLKLYKSAFEKDERLLNLDILTINAFDIINEYLYGSTNENFTINGVSLSNPEEIIDLYIKDINSRSTIITQYIEKLEQIIPTLQEIVAGRFKRALRATGKAFGTAGQAFGTAGRAVRNTTLKAARATRDATLTTGRAVRDAAYATRRAAEATGQAIGSAAETGMRAVAGIPSAAKRGYQTQVNSSQLTGVVPGRGGGRRTLRNRSRI